MQNVKLSDLFETEQKQKELPGTYVGVKFDDQTNAAILKYIADNNIPNGVPEAKLHTTVLYSRVPCPDITVDGVLPTPITGTPTGLDVWGDGKRCLVMTYDCPELVSRHEKYREEHGASHDFPDYQPHVTLSYDIGDMDISSLPEVAVAIPEVVINQDYIEDLDLDWSSKLK